MKILILQLARLGDIYMSWPAVRALRRLYPDAHIDLLTRPRFESAVHGLTAFNHHFVLPTENILEPLVATEADVESAVGRLGDFLNPLKAHKYDWVINLTFSPLSSFITHYLADKGSKVTGYSRFADGYFNPTDEISCYFYAQVGIDKPNRVHISDIFASMLNIEYVESDWAAPVMPDLKFSLPSKYLVIHVGASEQHKSLSARDWVHATKVIANRHPEMSLVLIGVQSEESLANEIVRENCDVKIVNLVGKTNVPDLFTIIQHAEIIVGCDSAPIHIASLTDTPTLNISLGRVNFWETGPKANISFILRFDQDHMTTSRLALEKGSHIGNVLCDLLDGVIASDLIVRSPGLASYIMKDESLEQNFQWSLVQAIYLGGKYPMAERIEVIQGAMKLNEINNFMIEQIAMIPVRGLEGIASMIEQAEELVKSVGKLVPELNPLINWYQTEKIRIAPGSQEEVRQATMDVHQRLYLHLRPYILENSVEVADGAL